MEIYLPENAKGKIVGYLAVSAHKDDVEIMAFDGIVQSMTGLGFVAAVLTDGGACPRGSAYVDLSDEQMAKVRTFEQKNASEIGGYEKLFLFERKSAEVKNCDKKLVEEVAEMLRQFPALEALYLHSPFDSHPTHVASLKVVLEALKTLPKEMLPKKVYGCEVWRDLDWLSKEDKVVFDVSGYDDLASNIMNCFESQNAIKRYDIASLARRKANATYNESHQGDNASALIFGIDLTQVAIGEKSLEDFVEGVLKRFKRDVFLNVR